MDAWKNRIPSILEHKDFWMVLLLFSTFFAFLLNLYSLQRDLTIITPHLFYIPIVIAAYWFPRSGVLYTVAISMGYLAMVYLIGYPDLDLLTQSTARFYVFVAIGVIVASLSNNLKEQEDRYHGLFDYSEAGVFLVMNLRSGFVIDEVNERGAELLGFKAREMGGRNLFDFFTEPHEKEEIKKRVSSAGAVNEFECHLKMKDGAVLHGLMSAGPLPGRRLVFTLVDITARKKAEGALRESKERYQGLYNNAQVGLARVSVGEGCIIDANQQMASMFGYSSVEEFKNEFRFPDHYVDGGVREQLIASLDDCGMVSNFDARFTRRDGTIFWARFWARIIPEKGYTEEVFTDVTGEKHSHRALDESEERYRKLVDNLPDYILVYSQERILYVNPAAARVVGMSLQDITGTSIYQYIDPQCREKVRAHSMERAMGNFVDPYEITLSFREGRPRTVLVNATPIIYQGQDATLAVLTDITERKAAEEELAASKDQYVTTINAMIDGIFLVDRKNTILLVNTTFERWLAHLGKTGSVIGQNVEASLPCIASASIDAIGKVFENGMSTITTTSFRTGPKEYVYETRHIPVFEEGHVERVMTIMRDITKERVMEEEKRLAYQQIEKNIEQFAILGDHLRNPVQVIMGLADLEGGPLAQKIHQQTEEIDRTITQLDRGWIESEKIREFIRKYYGIGK